MNDYPVSRPIKRPPTHPGALMREILAETLRLPVSRAAEQMGISRQSLYAALSGKSAVSADMAVRFAALTGAPPALYLNMQAAHDLWHARARLDESGVLGKIARVA